MLEDLFTIENGKVKFTVNVAFDPVSALWLAGAIFVGLVLALLIYSKIR
ncbi:MAG: hypothetical protein KDC85_18295 [Saprospiraceae bacterium]|nr:hypothetical protein [Saprospiraceae bacterium]MCB9325886.1 hypothetical protein [Lewinellaceae bacterium]